MAAQTSWAAAYICWVLEHAGIESTKSARARSYESWGQPIPVDALCPGAIVVFWRGKRKNEGKGHVGFYLGGDPRSGRIALLSGNTNDAVSVTVASTERVVAYRWPPGVLPPPERGALARVLSPGDVVAEKWS